MHIFRQLIALSCYWWPSTIIFIRWRRLNLRPTFWDLPPPCIPLSYHILNKHRARKYRRPLTTGLKFVRYTATGKIPPLSSRGQVLPQYKVKCVLRPTFWDLALPYIPPFYYILKKHQARKYWRPLIRSLKFLGYTSRGKVPPLYKAKCVSRPTFWDLALPCIPLFHYILNKHRPQKYRRPLIRGLTFLGYTSRSQVPLLYKAKWVFRPTFWDIALPYIPLFYHILNKHRAPKYWRPLIRDMKFLGYTSARQVPLMYKAKCVSRPTFKDLALPYIPLFYILNKHRAQTYRRPLIRYLKYLGYTSRGQVPPLYQWKWVCAYFLRSSPSIYTPILLYIE
jgi:hypothetical protein